MIVVLLLLLPTMPVAGPATKTSSQAPSSRRAPRGAAKGALAAKAAKQALFAKPVSPKKPPAALTKISARLTKTRVLRAAFTQQKKLKALRFPLRSSGRFLFASRHGIAWQFKVPFQVAFVITPRQIIQRAHGKETRISGKKKPLVMGFTRMFLTIFQGDTKALHKHFQVYFQGSDAQWRLGLRPKHPILRKIFSHITLQGKQTIQRVDMAERSGDHTILRFSGINTKPLSNAERTTFGSQR